MKKIKRLTSSLIICALFVSLITCYANAWSITPGDINFYSNTAVKTVYTKSSTVSYVFYDPYKGASPDKSILWVAKETYIGSGEYSDYARYNYSISSPVPNINGHSCLKFQLPSEGRYKIQFLPIKKGTTNDVLYNHTYYFKVVYSNIHMDRGFKVVDEAASSYNPFAIFKGGKVTITATIHDLSKKGVTASQIKVGLANMEAMRGSYGRASLYWANDIKVTRSTKNLDEYFISCTVDTAFFKNRVGEYYIDFMVLNGSSYHAWGDMIPHIYIK